MHGRQSWNEIKCAFSFYMNLFIMNVFIINVSIISSYCKPTLPAPCLRLGPKRPPSRLSVQARLRALAFLQMFNSACLDSSLFCPDTHSVISDFNVCDVPPRSHFSKTNTLTMTNAAFKKKRTKLMVDGISCSFTSLDR